MKEICDTAKTKTVMYFPVDAYLKKEWVTDCLAHFDRIVAYNEYGKNAVLEHEHLHVDVIHHGANKKFTPAKTDAQRNKFRKMIGLDEDAILITNVNRNQPRKDLLTTVMAFDMAANERDDIHLYLHCDPYSRHGIDFSEVMKFVKNKERILFANPEKDYSTEDMVDIYRASDLVFSTTLGEGAGLSFFEGIACEVPVAAPHDTSVPELQEDLIGGIHTVDPMDYVSLQNDNGLIRKRMSLSSAYLLLGSALGSLKDLKSGASVARKHLMKKYNWDDSAKAFHNIFNGLTK